MDIKKFEKYLSQAKAHLLTLNRDEWDTESANAIKRETIEKGEQLLRGLVDRAIKAGLIAKIDTHPSFDPLASGGVDIDWDCAEWGFLIEVDADGHVEYYGDVSHRGSGMLKSKFEVENMFPALTDEVIDRVYADLAKVVEFACSDKKKEAT